MVSSKRERAVVIGCGGGGKFLLSALARFMVFDPEREWALVLIDGDEYEVGNATRQAFRRIGNKAEVTAEELREQLPELLIQAISAYVAGEESEAHADHARLTVPISEVVQEGDWVFLCVDNHATRKLVSSHAQTLQSVRVFSAGNDYSDGNVQVYVRRSGNDVLPPLDAYHPEIAAPEDQPPYAMSCEELAQAGTPQLIFANFMAAALVAAAFWAELTRQLRAGEIYFDLAAQTNGTTGPAALPVSRK